MKLVVDTSIIIDYLRGNNLWENLLIEVKEPTTFYLPTIVIYELFSGKSSQKTEVKEKIKAFAGYFERIELTERLAEEAGELYRESTIKASAADYIIAASALSIGGSLITLNQKHFQQIPGLNLYS